MVNAAVEIKYGKDFYKEGDKLPAYLVNLFEAHNPSLLDTYIEINAKWRRIDDPGLAGFIKERKHLERRLKRYFKIRDVKPVEEQEPEKMLKVKEEPKPKPKYTNVTFKALRRKKQESILTKLGVSFSRKDKERDLIRKYLKNV